MMDDDIRSMVAHQGLGFVATTRPDGAPSVSPKGTTEVWDDDHLVFLDLHSPGTVANLRADPRVEVNVVDPVRRKGYRFTGRAEVLTGGELYDRIVARFVRTRGTDPTRVRSAVLMRVDAVGELVSPAYDSGATEDEVAARWRARLTQPSS